MEMEQNISISFWFCVWLWVNVGGCVYIFVQVCVVYMSVIVYECVYISKTQEQENHELSVLKCLM